MSGIDDWIGMVRDFGLLPGQIAKDGAKAVGDAVRKNAAAGNDPYGRPWPPAKDGHKALANVASHITEHAYATVIRIVLSGVDVYHNYGPHAGKGKGHGPRRQVLWDTTGEMPPLIAAALKEVSIKAFLRLTRHGSK